MASTEPREQVTSREDFIGLSDADFRRWLLENELGVVEEALPCPGSPGPKKLAAVGQAYFIGGTASV
jgi:hypothetical protein